jgi:hypothetical protein
MRAGISHFGGTFFRNSAMRSIPTTRRRFAMQSPTIISWGTGISE